MLTKTMQANKTIVFLFTPLLVVLLGCGHKTLSPDRYLEFYKLNKNELTKTREAETLEFEASYIPTDLMALGNVDYAADAFDKSEFSKLHKNYDSAFYFTFKIKTRDENFPMKKLIKSKENYAELNRYINADIKNDFYIELGEKKINCGIINAESDLAIRNAFTFVMSFEKLAFANELTDDITLIYHDKIFQNGILKFHFSKSLINNFPKIKAI